jgi:hypothetical protein
VRCNDRCEAEREYAGRGPRAEGYGDFPRHCFSIHFGFAGSYGSSSLGKGSWVLHPEGKRYLVRHRLLDLPGQDPSLDRWLGLGSSRIPQSESASSPDGPACPHGPLLSAGEQAVCRMLVLQPYSGTGTSMCFSAIQSYRFGKPSGATGSTHITRLGRVGSRGLKART